MITSTKAFKTSDDRTFEDLALAQEHELELMLNKVQVPTNGTGDSKAYLNAMCKQLVAESDRVTDILSTRANSRTKARAVNGGRKKRTAKTDAAANLALEK